MPTRRQQTRTHAVQDGTRWGVYVHIPFCRVRCPYCDFAAYAGRNHLIPRYVDLLEREIRARAAAAGHPTAATLYLGGGTPSLLAPEQVAHIVDTVQDALRLAHGAEVTLEANPGTVDVQRLAGYRAAGVNRLSLGVESLDDRGLAALGRDHTAAESREAVTAARAAGFDNVSIDLIFGWQGQDLVGFRRDLEAALALHPDHLSLYGLTIEDRTVFGARRRTGTLDVPGDDLQARCYDLVLRRVPQVGLAFYEVSNFARPGRESVHNALYWNSTPYLGLGAGAHGFDPRGGPSGLPRRWWNVRAPRAWMAAVGEGRLPEAGSEVLGGEERGLEVLLTALRTRAGLDLGDLEQALGRGAPDALAAAVGGLMGRGLVHRGPWRRRHIRLTRSGLRLLDSVAASLAASLSAPGDRVGGAGSDPTVA